MTIEQYVCRHAKEKPRKTAVVSNGNAMTYRQLWQAVNERAEALRQGGLRQGMLNVFRTTQDSDFIITYLATHLAGAVAVPAGRDCPPDKLKAMEDECRKVTLPVEDGSPENIADILFTTGSTGRQKGVMESCRAIEADADNLIHAQGFRPDTVFVICGPLNHIGSLSKIWPTLTLGGTLVLLDGMKDIGAFFRAFGYPSRRLATFMVPASIRMVLQTGAERMKALAENIDFVETGGAAMAQSDMEALCRLLPHTRLYNTYASTETGIISTYDYNHNPCVAGCTGRPMRHSEAVITRDGTIACKGATLMSGYLGDRQLTAEVMHDGTVFTSDMGEIDSQGCLHIKGRNSDVINIGGYKVSPQEVENAAASFPQLAECLCCPTLSPVFGHTVKLIYTAKNDASIDKRALARHIAARVEGYKVPRVFEQVAAIRHTFNGKPDRKYYNGL